jgi:hypothetical protein
MALLKTHRSAALLASLAALALATLATLAACDPAQEPGLYEDQILSDPDAGEDAPDGEDPDQPGGQNLVDFTDMNGTWALARDFSTCVSVFGVAETRSYTLSLVQIEQTGSVLRETHEVCSLKTTPVIGLETVVPEAVFRTSNPTVVEGYVYGDRPGASYTSGPILAVWGIDLLDPLRDPLPEPSDPLDPRIMDTDEDGMPGVTLKVGGSACDLYVIQRDAASVTGILQADGSIEGGGAAYTQQVVLGATNPICGQRFETIPNPAQGYSKMVRVDRRGINLDADGDGEVGCEELIAAQDRVISWRMPDENRCAPAQP